MSVPTVEEIREYLGVETDEPPCRKEWFRLRHALGPYNRGDITVGIVADNGVYLLMDPEGNYSLPAEPYEVEMLFNF